MNDDEVYALTADDELVVISLVDLEVSVLAQGVSRFQSGSSERFVLWQGLDFTANSFGEVVAPLLLLDRETGESTQIDAEALLGATIDPFSLEALGLLYYSPSGLTGEPWRVVSLDTLTPAAPLPGLFEPWWGVSMTLARCCGGHTLIGRFTSSMV